MDETGLSDAELQALMQKLKHNLSSFPEGTNSLEYELESSAKHIPTYIKIVKKSSRSTRKSFTTRES